MRKKNTFILTILLLIIAAFSSSCKPGKKRVTTNVESQSVEIIKVHKNPIQERVFITGDLRGIEEVKLYSFVTGVLKGKFVADGQRVYKGQALFSVDQTYKTVDMLDHIVRSPITGIVSDIQLDVGDQVVTNSTVIARVVSASYVKVKATTSVKNIGKLKVGQKAIVEVEAFPNKPVTGIVKKISPVVDVDTRTVKIEIVIDNRNGKLKSGMFANVSILTDVKKDKILVPQACVLFDDNQNYVYKLDKSKTKALRQLVSIGENYSGNIIIKTGLSDGDYVISKGQYNVFHNFPINIIKANENITLNAE